MENIENTVNTGVADEVTTETESKTYTQEELNSLIQSESDKRVTDAMKKASRKQTDAVKEAQRLATMNADERYKYELEQREKTITERESQLALSENKSACISILADKSIPVQLADFVVDTDADVMQERIKTLDKYFKLAVKAEVEKRLSSNTPKRNLPLDGVLTKEQFSKLSIAQQTEIYNNNKELYLALTK